jgi:hypothetical protein
MLGDADRRATDHHTSTVELVRRAPDLNATRIRARGADQQRDRGQREGMAAASNGVAHA